MSKFFSKTINLKNEISSGLTVALALVPEAVAFAFVAGVDPLVGLYAAFMIGIITSIFGGRPGMISGATGALAVVMVSLVKEGNSFGSPDENLGLYYLFATVILMGVIQMLAGLFKLGKFVRLIPHPVMMGFVNGLAIVIFLSQLSMFKEIKTDFYGNSKVKTESTHPIYRIDGDQIKDLNSGNTLFTKTGDQLVNFETNAPSFEMHDDQIFNLDKQVVFNIEGDKIFQITKSGFEKEFIVGKKLIAMLLLVALTMGLMILLPEWNKSIPEALVAILVVSGIGISGILGLDAIGVETVGSFIRSGGGDGLSGGLPQFQFDLFEKVPFNLHSIIFILPYACILAAIGLIESLMTLNLVDELTETRGNSNRECLAQGGANIVTGFMGGMGGCAMIGQSIININGGARSRVSGIVAAITLLIFILFASEYIEQVPIAALVGVMFMVVIGTFAWSSIGLLHKIPFADALVLVTVSAITVWKDLAVAVIAGVIISALVFAWENALRIRARKSFKPDGTKVYEIWGPLFFGSIKAFSDKFDAKGDPDSVEVDFIESRVADHSGLEALVSLVGKYEALGKKIALKHLSEDCKELMIRANPKFADVIVHAIDDPRYHMAEDPESFSKPVQANPS